MKNTILCGASRFVALCCLLSFPVFGQTNGPAPQAKLEFIRIAKDGRHFVTADSGRKFTSWGCNYDHDRTGRLLEQYWETEWDTVAQDFAEMKALGANTVRIHLQVAHFMKSAGELNQESFQRLGRLLSVAERTGLYLDVTGLGCYDKTEVPPWYNALNETQRWEVQARFWEAVARTCNASPAVFCYDLMNEPIVTEDKTSRDWTPGAFGDRYYMQRITLDFAGRTDQQIAKAWVDTLATAIRKEDARHLITVGEIPWALTFPGAKPLFYSKEVGGNLDFVSVHFYPKKGEVDQALKALAVYDVGKPIVVEEMYPLNCPTADLAQFIDRSKPLAAGWISFYWGETIAEYKQQKGTISDAIAAGWLDYFAKKAPDILASDAQAPAPGSHWATAPPGYESRPVRPPTLTILPCSTIVVIVVAIFGMRVVVNRSRMGNRRGMRIRPAMDVAERHFPSMRVAAIFVVVDGVKTPVRMTPFPTMETRQTGRIQSQPDMVGPQIKILVAHHADIFRAVPDIIVRNADIHGNRRRRGNDHGRADYNRGRMNYDQWICH